MATDSISPEDIAEAFARIEDELLASMMRNMAAHRVEELDSGAEWAQWQAVQLQGLHDYARRNNLDCGPAFDELNGRMEEAIAEAYGKGYAAQEAGILDAISKGWEPPQADMLRPSPHRLDALLKATHDDMMRAEHATLRRAEDIYRKTIFSAQLYATSGAGTYEKAVDMAVVDFLKKGVDGIVYKNGSRHTIREYSQMAVRTAAKRAAMAADGDARRDWGVHTIFVNYRADACPECMEWVGQVLIDDVYSGGTPEEAAEGGYALLSDAMAQGLFHPNCRDTQSTYFEGINEPPKPFTPDEMGKAEEGEAEEQARSQAEQSAREWGRAAEMLLDPADKAEAQAKAKEWEAKAEQVDVLTALEEAGADSDKAAEAYEWYVSGEGQHINQQLRGIMREAMTDYEKDAVDLIDSLMDEHGNKTLYRSVDISALGAQPSRLQFEQMEDFVLYGDDAAGAKARIDAIVGREIAEKGFMSTTKDLEIAADWRDFTGAERPVVLEIAGADKAAGIDMERAFPMLEERMGQAEVTLERGTRYVVRGYRAEAGSIVFEVEIIPRGD